MYYFKIETHAYLFPNIGSYCHTNIPLMSNIPWSGTEEVKTQSFLIRVKVHKTQEGKECRSADPLVVKEVLVEVPVDVSAVDLEAIIAEALQGVLEFLKEPFDEVSEGGSDVSDEEEDSLDVSDL